MQRSRPSIPRTESDSRRPRAQRHHRPQHRLEALLYWWRHFPIYGEFSCLHEETSRLDSSPQIQSSPTCSFHPPCRISKDLRYFLPSFLERAASIALSNASSLNGLSK